MAKEFDTDHMPLELFAAVGGVKSPHSLHLERDAPPVLKRRKLTRQGVYFEGVIYSSPDLMKLRHGGRMSVSLLVGRDPFCPRSLVVFVENSNRAYRAFAVKR